MTENNANKNQVDASAMSTELAPSSRLRAILQSAHSARASNQSVSDNELNHILALANNELPDASVDDALAMALSSKHHQLALRIALAARAPAIALAQDHARLQRVSNGTISQPIRGEAGYRSGLRWAWIMPALALIAILGVHKPSPAPQIQTSQMPSQPDVIGMMASSFEEGGASGALPTSIPAESVREDTLFTGDFDS